MSDNSPVVAFQDACKRYHAVLAVDDPAERAIRLHELNTLWRACFERLMEVAHSHDPEIWFSLGTAYNNGWGIERNPAEAIQWFQRGAEAGHTRSMVLLALSLHRSKTPADVVAAIRWFLEAAVRGDPNGMVWLGFSYREGTGVTRDLTEAVKWFIKAVEAGDERAAIHVGRMYAYYLSSPALAVHWFLRSAEAGDSDSFMQLASLYDKRDSEVYDPAKAIKWYHAVADGSGSCAPRAMLSLARRYRDGVGAARDPVKAKHWLDKILLTAPEGCKERKQAIKLLKDIREELI